MLVKILIGLAVLVLLLVVVVALQPSEFRITRTATIAAPPSAVFTQVNDFHKWEAWSPWAKLDPAVRNTFEGAPAGTGAVFAWAGNSKVGFDYPDGPVKPRPEKLPEPRRAKAKRRSPPKRKPPGGGDGGPPRRGIVPKVPLVKV